MGRIKSLIFLAILAGGVYFFLQNFEIQGLNQLGLRWKKAGENQGGASGGGGFGGLFGGGGATSQNVSNPTGTQTTGERIRIATFNVQVFGTTKTRKPMVMQKLAGICRRFDIVAIQEIVSPDQDILPRLVEQINNNWGAQYDYVVGPRLGRDHNREQYGFVFNSQTVEVNRSHIYTLNDPNDLLHREPLVASFRTRSAPPEQAFTFSLVNIHTDPNDLTRELSMLDDVLRLVRNDKSREDDVIMLGNFNTDDRNYGELGAVPGLAGAIRGLPTNTRGTHQLDNILFAQQATVEFTGRSGVFDFLREFNLTTEQALEISDHIPVWAEFSIYEGGVPGHVATKP